MNSLHIVILDKYPIYRQSFEVVLSKMKMIKSVQGFEASGKLLDFLNQTSLLPSILIMEINIDCGDGFEFLKKIKQEFPPVKIIVFSPEKDTSIQLKAMECGATAYLSKSVDLEVLEKTIEELSVLIAV